MNSCEGRRVLAGTIIGMMLIVTEAIAGAPQNRAELENFVIQDCGSCHGLTMRGGLGPPLRPQDLEQLPEGAIAAIIREGVDGTAMPPWKALLTDEEMLWISRQLKAGSLIDSD